MEDAVDMLGGLLEDAASKHCSNAREDGCYTATCPINCIAFLMDFHLKTGQLPMLYGDYLLLTDYAKRRA